MSRRSLWVTLISTALLGYSAAAVSAQVLAQPTPPPDVKFGPSGPIFKITPIKIDPKTPLAELLPTPPKGAGKVAPPLNDDLMKVAEIGFGEPLPRNLQFTDAVQRTANIFAKVNHLNQKKDGFMLALLAQRNELQGLPFQMGDSCHTSEEKGRIMPFLSATINQATHGFKNGQVSADAFADILAELQTRPTLTTPGGIKVRVSRDNEGSYYSALVATLTQVLGPEPDKLRVRFARSLATIPHIDATKALARLALFAPEKEVRATALEGLRLRRDQDYTDVLLQGFQYPLPEVSKRAAEALIKLERKDLLGKLVDVLDAADPRMPTMKRSEGKEVAVVRELVKVNHHHNCALCHAPANTPDVPAWALKVGVQLPSEPFPSDGSYNRPPTSPSPPEIFVRIDMTYLRQDFSMMLPVADPAPWPALQRFDFFVRTRELTKQESQAWSAAAKSGSTPYQQAALLALRELTGRDAEPNAQAWRTLLKLPAPTVQ